MRIKSFWLTLAVCLSAVVVINGQCYGSGANCVNQVRRVTSSYIPTNKSCPTDYVLYGNQCVKSVVQKENTNTILRCPPGFAMVGSSCEQVQTNQITAVPVSECPTGSYRDGSQCKVIGETPTIVTSADVKCPDGFTYDGRTCIKPEPSCPQGYTLYGGWCMPPTPPIPETVTTPPILVEPPPPVYQPPCPYSQGGSYGCYPYPRYQQIPQPVQPVSPIVPIKPIYETRPPIFPPTTVPQPSVYVPFIKTCPADFFLSENMCIKTNTGTHRVDPTVMCPFEYELDGDICVKKITTTETVSPDEKCPNGYIRKGNGCYNETEIDNPTCTQPPCFMPPITSERQTVLPSPDVNIHNTISKDIMISNHVPINVTTNVHSNNTNTVVVHLNSGGSNCRTVQTTNNTSVITCDEVDSTVPATEQIVQPEKPENCCEVVSPRICKRLQNQDWFCSHKKTQVCGPKCTHPKIYLQPKQPIYRPSYMVMPPMPIMPPSMYYRANDCSGCMYGSCSRYCGQYEGCGSGGCNMVSQDSFCADNGGRPCTQDFGCVDGGHCE